MLMAMFIRLSLTAFVGGMLMPMIIDWGGSLVFVRPVRMPVSLLLGLSGFDFDRMLMPVIIDWGGSLVFVRPVRMPMSSSSG
ncbi:MAG: hypothetical protein WD490_06395 [Opitutales bacterium]